MINELHIQIYSIYNIDVFYTQWAPQNINSIDNLFITMNNNGYK